MSAQLFLDTMEKKPVTRVPSVPKIWADLAANIMGYDYLEMLNTPQKSAISVIEAAKVCKSDGARLFLFPKRTVIKEGEIYYQVDDHGRKMGKIHIDGGWATQLSSPQLFDGTNAEMVIGYHFFQSHTPIVATRKDVDKIEIPSLAAFHKLYDFYVEQVLQAGGDEVYCIGDCNSGTMAFCASLMGMSNAMLNLYDDPELMHYAMQKGIQLSITQGKFMADKGIRVLRYNDSVGNMSLMSPDMWREFVFPYLKLFCEEIHAYCSDVKIYCHICGNILPIVKELKEAGLDCIAPLDPLGGFSVGEVRKIVGDDMVLMGGVNTMSFLQKTDDDVIKEGMNCIKEGFSNGKFVLGSGCVVPRKTEISKLQALYSASVAMKK